jgi:hypothetical protein
LRLLLLLHHLHGLLHDARILQQVRILVHHLKRHVQHFEWWPPYRPPELSRDCRGKDCCKCTKSVTGSGAATAPKPNKSSAHDIRVAAERQTFDRQGKTMADATIASIV